MRQKTGLRSRQITITIGLSALIGGAAMMPAAAVAQQKPKPGAAKKPAASAGKKPPSATSASAAPLTTLDRALERVAWDESKGGVLLVVDPARTQARSGATAPASGNLALSAIAPHFDRKVATVGSVQVVAPARMVVMNEQPGEPDVFQGLTRAEKVRYLMASLTPEQWQKLGSPEGLGRDDLTDDTQKKQFDAIIPAQMRVARYVRNGSGAFRRQGESVPLTAEQRAQVRLRARRGVDMLLHSADRPGTFIGFTRRYEGQEVKEYAVLDEGQPDPSQVGGAAYGAALRKIVPNEPKPGELNFAVPVLAAKVSLDGILTIGDLIKRVGEATKLEIYADRRVARVPVTIRGATAKAGELLKAVALAVTGTYRKIDTGAGGAAPAYILTEDLVGFGARQVSLADWLQGAEARKRQVFEEMSLRMAAQKPLAQIGFAENDPLAPGEALVRRIEEQWEKTDPRVRLDVPFADLPPGLQAYVKEEAARRAEGMRPQPVRTDTVKVGFHLRYSFLVPGVGEVEEANPEIGEAWMFLPRPMLLAGARAKAAPALIEPVALPSTVPTRSLLVSPKSAEEAARTVDAARGRGFNQLWVASNDPAVIAAAVESAKPHSVPVYAVVRLLRPSASKEGNLDRTILGVPPSEVEQRDSGKQPQGNLEALLSEEDNPAAAATPVGDWLAPDAANPKLLAARIAEIAKTPGLAGLVLQDTLPPGYGEYEGGGFLPGEASAASGARSGETTPARFLGYTPQMRLAFLRREGVDPMDLVPASVRGDGSPGNPFFRDESGSAASSISSRAVADPAARRWNAFKRDANLKLMGQVFDTVREAAPKLPLLIRNRWDDQQSGGGASGGVSAGGHPVRWYALWDNPERLPEVAPGSAAEDPLRRASTQYKNLTLSLSWSEPQSKQDEAFFREGLRAFGETVQESHAAQGIVIDLSEMPADKAVSLLEGIAAK